jgi:hypothetical protein
MPSQIDHVLLLGPLSNVEPQPGLAPESALRLPPGRALSSAPAVRSVSVSKMLRKAGMKKSLIIAALSDMYDNTVCTNSQFEVSHHFTLERGGHAPQADAL